jgi:hypothetical protein
MNPTSIIQGASSYIPSPPVYNVQPGMTIGSYNQPIQIAHYQPPPGMFIKNQTGPTTSVIQVINQPSSYQVTTIQQSEQFNGLQGAPGYYGVGGSDVHRSTL